MAEKKHEQMNSCMILNPPKEWQEEEYKQTVQVTVQVPYKLSNSLPQ